MTFSDRVERLNDIVRPFDLLLNYPLLKALQLRQSQKAAVENAVNFYLYEAVKAHDPDFARSLSPNFFDENIEQILALPNITPNGLVLPKKENFLSYNVLHKTVAEIVRSWKIDAHIDRIHVPVNIRLVSGHRNPEFNRRPRAATKAHSDIWAAEPAHCVMVFFAVFGDLARTGIEFFEPKSFPKELMRPLDDFALGESLMSGATQYRVEYPTGVALFTDPFLLHRTMQTGGSPRLSLDFRFLAKNIVASDTYRTTPRMENYVTLNEWYDYGTSRLVVSPAPLAYVESPDVVRDGYASRVETVKL